MLTKILRPETGFREVDQKFRSAMSPGARDYGGAVPSTAEIDGIRRRPKDRKAQIARASAEAFSAQGYHAVRMDEIAARVGISATALYRHYSGKYELFRDAVFALGRQLTDATAFVDDLSDAPPRDELRRVCTALADTAITNRETGGLYRWEWRYLEGDDRAALMAQIRLVNRRIQRPLIAMRPELAANERWVLSTSAMSVIGSVVDHRAKLGTDELRSVLVDCALAVAGTRLPAPAEEPVPRVASSIASAPTGWAGRYEALLHQSLILFNKQGYRETTMGEIAAAVGIPTSGIYRYFGGKQDILVAVFRRAAERVAGDLSAVLADHHADPVAALHALAAAYVASAFANPELGYVYYTERVNLPEADQAALRDIQRSTVGKWVELLCAARPEVPAVHARFAVHAAMALVIDVGRLVGYDDVAHVQAGVCRLMTRAMGL
jgi:AcrR family transcriptional regulator